jgi:hypothetical protein
MEITYEVRRSDLLWMYLGSWGARIAAMPGALFLLVLLIGWPPDDDSQRGAVLLVMVFALAAAVTAPIVLCAALMLQNGTLRLIDSDVRIRIDDHGVRGWPIEPQMDRRWPLIRRARTLRGVITLPFQERAGFRAGWVPIPERAMTPQQRAYLRDLLLSKGLVKNGRGGRSYPDAPSEVEPPRPHG